jgi:TonB family protein
MRRRIAITLAVLLIAGIFPLQSAHAQQASANRPILSKIAPRYPDLARPMRLEGTVKVDVLVAPNGSVKLMRAVGGSPILLKAAEDAIDKWRWAPASQETNELVELHFKAAE